VLKALHAARAVVTTLTAGIRNAGFIILKNYRWGWGKTSFLEGMVTTSRRVHPFGNFVHLTNDVHSDEHARLS